MVMREPTGDRAHFLDTSVVRPMLLGTKAYQQYFENQFGDRPRYISSYVQMEIWRSYLRNIIEFYFTLRLPTIPTFSDALTLWSNKYQASKHKAVEQLVAQLLSKRSIDFSRSQDKEKALKVLETLIRQFVQSFQTQFVNIGQDSTHCARATVPLYIVVENLVEELKRFASAFDDVETCRRQCQIDQFLLDVHRSEIEAYVQQAAELPINSQSRGFIRIAEGLKEIQEQGATACSCRRCEQIGDAVIALDAPQQMFLEHTDQSFDYLCPPIQQPHCKHPSEIQILKE
jgi:hypothetical protein